MLQNESSIGPLHHPEGRRKTLIVAVIVTMDRPRELETLLKVLTEQRRRADITIVVENSTNPQTAAVIAAHSHVRHVVSRRNLGGAGGFALGILLALAEGATYVWLMDDDGLPEAPDCLDGLFAQAVTLQADVTSPVIIDIGDESTLAFPYFIGGRRVTERHDLAGRHVIKHFAHLFNGALIKAETFARFGVPDYRLFVRGDEVDFLHRVRRGGGLVATIPDIGFRHPPGTPETFPIMSGRLHAVVPVERFKQYHFFRNRGYVLRRHKLVLQALSDVVRYPWHYLVARGGDWEGFRWWLDLMIQGWREDFRPCELEPPPTSMQGSADLRNKSKSVSLPH